MSIENDKKVKKDSIPKLIWCWIFHKKFQKRTGRWIANISIVNYWKCERCGCEGHDIHWVLG